MRCSKCGSENVEFSRSGFLLFEMYGEAWYCSNYSLVWQEVEDDSDIKKEAIGREE